MSNGTAPMNADIDNFRRRLRDPDRCPPPIAAVRDFVSSFGCSALLEIDFASDERECLRNCLLPVLWGDDHRALGAEVCENLGSVASTLFGDAELTPALAYCGASPPPPPPGPGEWPDPRLGPQYRDPSPTAPNASTAPVGGQGVE